MDPATMLNTASSREAQPLLGGKARHLERSRRSARGLVTMGLASAAVFLVSVGVVSKAIGRLPGSPIEATATAPQSSGSSAVASLGATWPFEGKRLEPPFDECESLVHGPLAACDHVAVPGYLVILAVNETTRAFAELIPSEFAGSFTWELLAWQLEGTGSKTVLTSVPGYIFNNTIPVCDVFEQTQENPELFCVRDGSFSLVDADGVVLGVSPDHDLDPAAIQQSMCVVLSALRNSTRPGRCLGTPPPATKYFYYDDTKGVYEGEEGSSEEWA